MSEKGDCWDNAVAESFFSTLEWELLRKRSFATLSQARRIVSEYIDQFFNPIRRHSTNGYFSPIEFELRWQSRQLTVKSLCPQKAVKLSISAKGRTVHLVISAPKRSRRPGELVNMIMCPLKVGKSMVAAVALIKNEVADGCVVAGVPARIIRKMDAGECSCLYSVNNY